jgi:hypothetical protein
LILAEVDKLHDHGTNQDGGLRNTNSSTDDATYALKRDRPDLARQPQPPARAAAAHPPGLLRGDFLANFLFLSPTGMFVIDLPEPAKIAFAVFVNAGCLCLWANKITRLYSGVNHRSRSLRGYWSEAASSWPDDVASPDIDHWSHCRHHALVD